MGPLLFLIHINDLDSVIQHSSVKLFADDTLFYAPANTSKDCSSLQDDLTAISSWAGHWQLKLNPSKCEASMITNKTNSIYIATPLTYFLE